MVFHWSLSDCKSPQVSRTFLGILADFSSAVVWMVSIRSLISTSFCLISKPLGIGLVWFYGTSTFVWYLCQIHFIYINSSISNNSVQSTCTVLLSKTVLFKTVQFRMSTQFQCQKQFYFKKFSLAFIHSLVQFDP